jgi:hypothetical protein
MRFPVTPSSSKNFFLSKRAVSQSTHKAVTRIGPISGDVGKIQYVGTAKTATYDPQ